MNTIDTMLWSVLTCACAALAATSALTATKLVTIAQGPVRGHKDPNTDVYVFRGIPYATGPTGRDRFKAPLPPPTWTEPFEAESRILCPQGWSPTDFLVQEDCLIANIYAPDTEDRHLPVMVSIHGGAFQIGYGDSDGPVALVNTKKIVAVNFNYRLGVHGFLCLGNNEAPGNAGIKDQVALLRWVRDNIAAFGGNPRDVTIVGCSAGGVSVDLLRLSSLTDGLINKALAASGGNAGSFGIQLDPIANAKFYANALNFDNIDDLSALTEFYTNSSLELLFSRSDLASNRQDSTVLWTPCIERDIGIERFLDDAPVNILKKGAHKHLPMLYGFTEMEGLMRLAVFEQWRHLMNDRFSDFLPGDLEFSSAQEKEEVATRVKQFYFGDEEIHAGNILTYIDYFTDVLFGYSMLRSVKLNGEHGKSTMFLYEYSFTDENTPIIPHTNVRGATHCDQYNAFFDEDESTITQEYQKMKSVLRKMLLDFVTTGNPVSAESTLSVWDPANANRDPHMHLNASSTLRGPLLPQRAQLWDSVYEAHYRTPIPPGNAASTLLTITSLSIVCLLVLSLS